MNVLTSVIFCCPLSLETSAFAYQAVLTTVRWCHGLGFILFSFCSRNLLIVKARCLLRASAVNSHRPTYTVRSLTQYHLTEHQLFQVNERSISIDFSSKQDSNAFLNLFSSVLFRLQALWQARWPLMSFISLVSWDVYKMARALLRFSRSVEGHNHR